MHFSSILSICVSIFNFPLSVAFLYRTSFSLTCKYRNNEHDNDSANSLGLDFERAVYAGEFSTDEGMEDDDLPQTCWD